MAKNYKKEIYKILTNPTKHSTKMLNKYHENDVADVFIELNKEERLKLYQSLDNNYISNLFTYLDDANEYIQELDINKAGEIINNMDADDAVDMLEEMDEEDRSEYFDLLDDEAKEDIRLINSYLDDEIGSMMTTNFIALNKNTSIKEAMKKIISLAPENDNINIIYFLNDDETYFGAISLKDLIIARESDNLLDIIKTSYPCLYDHDIIDNVLEDLKEYSLDSIPVLNNDNQLIGILTSDDIIMAVDEELKEDYSKLAALSGEFQDDETVWQGVLKRIPWLFTLLALAFIVSSVISSFEAVLKELTIVVFFQSLVLDMAGNSGTQSLAVTIRIISDDVSNKLCVKLLGKEFRIGLVNGLIIGVSALILVTVFLLLAKSYNFQGAFKIASIVLIALVVAMSCSSLIGSLIPILFKKMKIDPAVASGPFITTINDLIAIVIYYGFAGLLLL